MHVKKVWWEGWREGHGRGDGRDEIREIPLFKGLSAIRREGWGTFVKESTKIRTRNKTVRCSSTSRAEFSTRFTFKNDPLLGTEHSLLGNRLKTERIQLHFGVFCVSGEYICQSAGIYNSKNYFGLIAKTYRQTTIEIYNSRNYFGLIAEEVMELTHAIYNSRNYFGLIAQVLTYQCDVNLQSVNVPVSRLRTKEKSISSFMRRNMWSRGMSMS